MSNKICLKVGLSFLLIIWILNTANAKTWSNLTQEGYIDELVACQLQVKELAWSHTIWPKVNKKSKPLFKDRVNKDKVRSQVLEVLNKEEVLLNKFDLIINHKMLQNELNRMAKNTKDPDRLREYFQLFNNDASSIVECLVRPSLVKSLLQKKHQELPFKNLSRSEYAILLPEAIEQGFILPKIAGKKQSFEVDSILGSADTWMTINDADAPDARLNHTAVWTGSKMIVWGGSINNGAGATQFQSGGLYDPAFDSWEDTPITVTTPSARVGHTAIWTGTYMVIWGGNDGNNVNTGGRFDPINSIWSDAGFSNLSTRLLHTAVWTGSKMIIWGGFEGSGNLNSGGVYDPFTNIWSPTQLIGAPSIRNDHTAVWTGSKMIIWGGINVSTNLNDGGIYDLANNSWTNTSTTGNVPSARNRHTAVWTGSDMLIWSGSFTANGGIYNLSANSWSTISTTNAPTAGQWHSAIWTGTEMIVWGGFSILNTGARYIVDGNWTATSTTGAPSGRELHTAVWTGSSMIVWGGTGSFGITKTGSVYLPDMSYSIGVTATGLIGTNPMTLQNNGSNDLLVNVDGDYMFSSPVIDGLIYDVSISMLPNSPMQNCGIANGSGIVNGADVNNIVINCADIILQDGFENIP